jgi:YD repeat-containing protein
MFRRIVESLPSFFCPSAVTAGPTAIDRSVLHSCEIDIRRQCCERVRRILLLCVFAAFLSFARLAEGQVAPGTPNFVPEDCHEADCVDLMNNNVTLHVPVMSKSGAFPFSFSLTGADSYITPAGPGVLDVPLSGLANSILGLGGFMGWTSLTHGTCSTGSGAAITYSGFYVKTGDGTIHPLPPADYVISSATCPTSLTDMTTDGSGFTATIAGNASLPSLTSLYNSSGMSISASALKDSNGNSISYNSGSSGYTDTLGVPVLTSSLTTSPVSYTWSDGSSSNPPAVDVASTGYTLRSAFGCSSFTDYDLTGQTLPTSISFPDSTALALTWEQTPGFSADRTGRVATITLREEGLITYNYNPSSGANDGLDCTYLTPTTMTRVTADGTTTYNLSHPVVGGTIYEAVNKVVDNGGNNTIYTFTGFNATGNQALPVAQVVTQIQREQGTTLLTTDTYSYNTAFNSNPNFSIITNTVNSYPINEIVVYHQINGMTTFSATDTKFDRYGNVTYSAQYDFGGTSPAHSTTITYGSCTASCNTNTPTISNTAMAANKIYNKPGEVVTQQNGTTVKQANYTYDAKGNLDSRQVWTGSSFVGQTSPNTYNTNGTIATSYDMANNETEYSYNGTYSDNCGSSLNPVFPTRITNVGTGLYTQASYDCTGGVKLTDVDANGNTTTYCYNTGTNCSGGTPDPFWRVLQIADPYSATVIKTYPSGSYPDTINGSFTFNSGNSINSMTITTDGYGRAVNSQTAQSPTGSNYDTVSNVYGWSGNYRQITSSQPCSASSGGTCTQVHTLNYDPLGRLYTSSTTNNEMLTHTYTQNDDLAVLTPPPTDENSKQVQTEYDGLGRVTKVCRIGSTTNTGSGTACGQKTGSANGATDVYTYGQTSGQTSVSVERCSAWTSGACTAGQTRTNYYDALGRLFEKITPEGGTWSYYYDTYSSCPTGYKGAAGKLAAVKDPNGNLICYAYDALNRVTGVNASGTTCRHFYYDATYGTLPSGVSTPLNTLGRLAEDSTDNCSGSLITDEWHSYDDDGRETDYYQSTPHSTQYYHSKAAFYANGAINTIQLASPSLYTLTYGLDGEGRWDTLEDGSNMMVTGPTGVYPNSMYDPAGHVLNVQLTGTTPDQDTYTYDPNTGRMKTFEFEVGNTPANLTGRITWNPNGTLGHVQVVDGFNSGGSSTCYSDNGSWLTYGYDDWGRLLAFDCGSGNVAEYTQYDIYDNVTQTVPSGISRTGWIFSPGYNPNNNQVNGNTYDSNGNTTADGGSNTYGYNEFSKVKWTATSGTPTCGTSGKCVTYDAFGRMVETSNGSAWVELWYPQVPGARVTMNGASQNFSYWPSPGRGIYIESSTKTFIHPDWLGNDRIVSAFGSHTVTADRDYTPYGQQFNSFGSANPIYGLFAGMPGDYNSGTLFDTPNREFAVNQLRWTSPDPAGSGWNQYAYPTDPNTFNDPSGLCENHSSKIASINCYNNPPEIRTHPQTLRTMPKYQRGGTPTSLC